MTVRTLTFRPSDQRTFARLSGDFNPIHMDPAVARRLAAGEPIVHGMHALLGAIEHHFARTPAPVMISARFERPIIVGDTVEIAPRGSNTVAITLDGTLPLATISVQRADRASPARRSERWSVPTTGGIRGAHGVMALTKSKAIGRAFPHAARALGLDAVTALAAISRLVGMECPGRDSLLSAVSVRVDRAAGRHLHWRVALVDSRFSLVRLEVDGGGIQGTVDAFLRPPPVPPPSWTAIAAAVTPHEFDRQRALVVGGSRGLGAVTAQLIAAGGGSVLATFAAGKVDATALRRDASRVGYRVNVARFDVLHDSTQAFARLCRRFRPTHLYYFATPRIFGRRRDPFDAARFEAFARFYVTEFAAACRSAMETAKKLDVLYPSTTSVGSGPVRELTEYAAAKAAGESLCASLNASIPGLHIAVRRLPRVATDQTATMLPVPAAEPLSVMLPILRELHRQGGTGRS